MHAAFLANLSHLHVVIHTALGESSHYAVSHPTTILLLLLILLDCKWVVNPVTALIQYGTTNTHNNNK
jgi:hypothetical protein